jgi:hypothetical protein
LRTYGTEQIGRRLPTVQVPDAQRGMQELGPYLINYLNSQHPGRLSTWKAGNCRQDQLDVDCVMEFGFVATSVPPCFMVIRWFHDAPTSIAWKSESGCLDAPLF